MKRKRREVDELLHAVMNTVNKRHEHYTNTGEE